MAGDSRSPLRSSSRLGGPAALASPPSAIDTRPAPATRLGKRLRPAAEPHDDARPTKVARPDVVGALLRPQSPLRGSLKAEPAKGARGRAVAPRPRLRVTSAVQPRPNGSIAVGSSTLPDAKPNGTLHIASPLSHGINGTASKGSEGRSLRSQDGGSRCKSELSLYFTNYEDLISVEPRTTERLVADTRIFISEESSKSPSIAQSFVLASPALSSPSKPLASPKTPTLKPPSSPTSFHTLDLGSHGAAARGASTDPLSDGRFVKAHHRAERQEKQLRNIEKERAQHEKVQLERLLDGLLGPDWLRVMGISGVVEGERKRWDDKRAFFIREVRALLRKFRLWKEEERRRKVEKDVSTRDGDSSESGEDEEDEDEDEDEDTSNAEDEHEVNGQGMATAISTATDCTDVDALAAQQLHNETQYASGPRPGTRIGGLPGGLIGDDLLAPSFDRPFTSFFSKPHQRAAALASNRRTGRTRFAFGQPIPEMEPADFHLPPEFITPQSLKASARSRRLQRRNHPPS